MLLTGCRQEHQRTHGDAFELQPRLPVRHGSLSDFSYQQGTNPQFDGIATDGRLNLLPSVEEADTESLVDVDLTVDAGDLGLGLV